MSHRHFFVLFVVVFFVLFIEQSLGITVIFNVSVGAGSVAPVLGAGVAQEVERPSSN